MADIAKVTTEVGKTGLEGTVCSDSNKGAGRERESYVVVSAGTHRFEIGYWDDEKNRARTDDEIAAIAKSLCAARVDEKTAATAAEVTTK